MIKNPFKADERDWRYSYRCAVRLPLNGTFDDYPTLQDCINKFDNYISNDTLERFCISEAGKEHPDV